jgi:peptidoglycan/LPS O-acetylase OafA/YrhL
MALFLKIVLSLSEVLFDPFSYRFAPFEAAYFMLGILSHRMSARLGLSRLVLLTSSITLAALFFLSPILESISAGLLLLIWLPKLWQFDSEFSQSRILGAMSYPFYLIHLLVLQIFLWFLSEYTIRIEQTTMFISVSSISIVASLILQVALKIMGKMGIKFYAQLSSHVTGRKK